MSPEGPVEIGMREIYDLVLEVRQEVALLKTTEMKADIDDHEVRIRGLEKWVWRSSGIAATAGAIGGAILGDLMARLFA